MTENESIYGALRWASLLLQQHNREERVAEILLLHHLDVSKAQLLASMRDPIPNPLFEKYQADIHAHVKTGIPVQHLTGKETFYGRNFAVDKHVLIPRPETEELVYGVLDYINQNPTENRRKIVDVGTGSGVIAITLKLENPDLDVYASDISDQALKVAKQNAKLLGADVNFHQGDLLTPFIDLDVDIIVSNPPYIPLADKDTLADTVRNYDPSLALFAEDNGLAAYQQIIKQSTDFVDNCELLAFEIGHQQGMQVSDIIKRTYPQSFVDIRQDINKKDRMVFAKIKP